MAWLLGLITLGIAVYFIYMHITGSSFECSQCSAELTAWCARCYRICGGAETNWNGAENFMHEKLKECMNKCDLGSERNSCDGSAFEFCKGYIGI